MLRNPLFILLTICVISAKADWRDDIGLTQLEAELGASAPDGEGVAVTQVEAPASSGGYLPQNNAAGTGNFTGKVFTNISGVNTQVSSHAATVGNFFYGNSSGVAEGVSSISCYEANNFLSSGFLKAQSSAQPAIENSLIQNHSWIANLGSDSLSNDVLRRLDFAIGRDEFLACVGLNNGSGTAVPDLMASAYNVLSVGRSNGGHSRGTTASSLDGSGRIVPGIVAPQTATSWSTGIVSGAAALLLDTPEGQDQPSEVIKAILMAGATKDEFPGWSRSTTSPLDGVFGAGELNVYNNHQIVSNGEQNSSFLSEVSSTGWDYNDSVVPNIAVPYYFSVPVGFHAVNVSAVLTWNRTIENSGFGPFFIPSPIEHDFSLRLSKSSSFSVGSQVDFSNSPVDNVEHVYQESLSSGQYVMELVGDSDKDYALAWRATILPNPDIVFSDVSVSEGETALEFNVSLSSLSQVDTKVSYTTSSLGAEESFDYAPTSGVLTIPAGELSASFLIPIFDDEDQEGNEMFRVSFSNTENGNLIVNQAEVTILDNDPEPTVSVEDVNVDEGSSLAVITLLLSSASNVDVSLEYATGDDSAEMGFDYTGASGTLVIPAGDLSGMIEIPILEDSIAENNETFFLNLTNSVNADLESSTVSLLIVDDDFESVLENSVISFERDSGTNSFSIGWPAIIGRIYTIETSTNLVDWSSLDGAIGLSADSANEFFDLGASIDQKRFFRIFDVTNNPSPEL